MTRREWLLLLGGAAIAPRSLHAQQKAIPVIGALNSTPPDPNVPLVAAFREGLNEASFAEGKNVAMEYRWADGHYDRLPPLAAELVSRKVDLIAAQSDASALAAKTATSTIPIVFIVGADPVAAGLVPSLARPGGNLTGVGLFTVELNAKRIELVSELVPQAAVIALLVKPQLFDHRAHHPRRARSSSRERA